jgi:hypothetical protein
LGQLKSTLYARMEEVSFRAGAVVAGGVLAAAGVAITLAVVLGSHSDVVASASAYHAAPPSLAPPPVAPVSSAPSPTPRPSRTATRATAAGTYQPPSATRASATLHAAATPTLGRTFTSRRLDRRASRPAVWPGWRSWQRSPPWPWPWSLSRRHHRRR